jgi:hypothetical protein
MLELRSGGAIKTVLTVADRSGSPVPR